MPQESDGVEMHWSPGHAVREAVVTPPPHPVDHRDASGTVFVTSATGGIKGQKLARFDMIPPSVLVELATHYGKGEAKYPSDEQGANWQKGYAYSLSIAALLRHLNAWLMGEDFDPETGSSHLVAVVWHATALRWFQIHGKGTDDRRA